MKIILVLPLLIPLATAVACLLAWGRIGLQRVLGITGAGALLVAAIGVFGFIQREGIIATQMAGWPAPFGISLVADHLAAVMLAMTGLIGLAGAIYSIHGVDRVHQSSGYFALLHFLLMGICGVLLTGDLFNLYVWFELMLIASFVLMVLGNERRQLEGTIKYVLLSIVASLLLLTGIGLLYGLAGTLNLAELAQRLPELQRGRLLTSVAMLMLTGFGTKAAIFPLFFWLPASYHTAPVAVTAIFGGLMTKVGVYALIRMFTLLFAHDPSYTHNLMLVLGGLTMVSGVLGAVAQSDMRRLLSFHIISQVGYMLVGLGLFTAFSLAATLLFMVHIIVTKTALFFVSGLLHRLQGSYSLEKLGGLYRHHPGISMLFLVPALSLGGIPPLSGFFAKLSIVQAGFARGQYAIIAAALVVSLLTLYSMTKIWTSAFWGKARDSAPPRALPRHETIALALPPAVLAVLVVAIGLAAGPVFEIALQAGEELMNPEGYISAVLTEAQ